MSAPPPYPAQVLQPGPAAQQTVVLSNVAPPNPADQERGDRTINKGLRVTGWLQATAGGCAVVFGIVSIIIKAWQSYFATCIWMGIFFIISGSIGIRSSTHRHKCNKVAYMVLSIISSVMAFPLLITYFVFVAHEPTMRYDYSSSYYHDYEYHNICNPGYYDQIVYNCAHKIAGRQVVDALVGLCGLVEAVSSIVGAVYCCRAICGNCCCPTQGSNATAYYSNPQAQAVVYPPGQVYVQVPQSYAVAQPPPGNMYPGQPGGPGYPGPGAIGQPQVPLQYAMPPQQAPAAQPPQPAYNPQFAGAPQLQQPPTYSDTNQQATAPEQAGELPEKGVM